MWVVSLHLLSSSGAASVLSDGIINPNPFWLLKNLTRPVLRGTACGAGTDIWGCKSEGGKKGRSWATGK